MTIGWLCRKPCGSHVIRWHHSGTCSPAWGSNILVPHRPVDEDRHSSRISMSFGVDPPTLTALSLELDFRGHALKLRWPNAADPGRAPLTLVSSGPRRYTLVGNLSGPESGAPQYHRYIEFRC